MTAVRRLALLGCLVLGLLAVPAAARADPTCSPAPDDCSGWYRTDVTVTWDAGGTAGCDSPQSFTAEGVSTAKCHVTYPSGLIADLMQPVRIDKTPPTVTVATPDRNPDAGGWYRLPVGITFKGSDGLSGVRSCSVASYSGLDSAAASVPGTCTDLAGNTSAPAAFPLRFDATPPAIKRAIPGRKPDHDGWYNRPVTMHFAADDGLSGLVGCDPVLVAGPPSSQARAYRATCTDVAGNVATRDFVVPFDAEPPAKPTVGAQGRDRAVRLAIRTSQDTDRVRVSRTPGLRGAKRSRVYAGRPGSFIDRRVANGRRYRYTVTAFDQAGNVRRARQRAVAGAQLVAPTDGAQLTLPPLLRWTPVRGANYYNVQLFRDRRKVLSAWPARSRLQLRATWRYGRRVRHLTPGTYRWYVWPGFGRRTARRFGSMVGGSRFVVPAAPGT